MMSPVISSEKWKQIKGIFDKIVDLSSDEQKNFLSSVDDEEIRHEVEKMLVADSENILDESPVSLFTANGHADYTDKKFGRYKILSEIGRGGMGAVFEAVRDDGEFDQKVAVKIIKSGLDTNTITRRFRHERQILASLQHSNIAQLLDGGKSEDGQPYYVMEFIEGKPIDDYCFDNDLTVNEKLKLFLQVCEAVSYAHRRLIIHRDLKPSNILVTKDGQVKLLDFGIAKVLSENGSENQTATQVGLMTPNYASPEQFLGEAVTTSTDVYSLGVVLYELLTTTLPHDLTGLRLDEMLKAVCETDPIKPSSAVSRQPSAANTESFGGQRTADSGQQTSPKSKIQNLKSLSGDLDNIILKALKKEPERRYASVEQFAEDIRRHLEGLPVSARPDTFVYRTSKFIKRNKVGVIAASLIFLALVGGIVGTTYQARAAQRERERAEKRFEQVRKLANNVVFKYHDAIANLPGATETREMLVKDAIEYLDNLSQDAQDNPTLAQELALAYLKIGNVQGETYRANLGDSEAALKSYLKSVEILERLVRENPSNVEYLKNLHEASQSTIFMFVRRQQWKEAEEMGSRLLQIGEKLFELDPKSLEHQNLLARSFQIKGDTVEFSSGDEETIKWYRRSLEEAEKIVRQNPTNERGRRILTVATQRLGTRLEYFAEILKEKGAPESAIAPLYMEAEGLHRRTVELSEGLQKDFPQNEIYVRFVAATSINLGTAMARVGKGNEGMPYLTRSLATYEKMADADPKNNEVKRDIAEFWQYMAFARAAMKQPAEAIEANQKSLKILEEITTNDPSNFEFLKQAHLTYNNTGDILFKEGKLIEALSYYQKGMAYATKMSELNNNPQITVLRSESSRKVGEAFLAIGEKNKSSDALNSARTHLSKAREELLALKQKNELGKNYEHKLDLIERDINRTTQP